MLDYDLLRLIWWALVGILLIGFAITDGFDLGVGALLTLIGRNDDERRIMINTVGPHWDGNQVWFITAGGAIFAAFPLIYATAFSGFYLALMLTLFALWMRPLGFDYRSKLEDKKWRTAWDWAIFASGFVPILIFGVAFGNLLVGVPYTFDEYSKATYLGSFFGLLNPFAILAGLISVSMILMHASVWLQLKTDELIHQRATQLASILGIATTVLFALAGIWIAFGIDGYAYVSAIDVTGPSNPLLKEVAIVDKGWLSNYGQYPWMIIAPVLGLASPIGVTLLSKIGRSGWAFVCSSLSLTGIILTAGFSMFPFLMPNSHNPSYSLTVWDASSSHLTLTVMFYAAMVFVPIVLSYTAWGFWVMRGKITKKDIDGSSSYAIY
ncbi:cytochrome d ubiquinol oxidase subunit II [Reinekea thalattae]|uniref:Cytochrome d ubiquinol oxidase subunit II n=1 Tax=Reinekea thalattae TaxID=2593301 RepID=A0A5C8ZA11_9GAMM|nr:cytochrome d ubiquinol oxidase subunit II [Reinekea thalattae]TXR54001.1 cytochrome d ubiquinol oxidase subunit II [Reinekea thalattae]